MAQTGHSFRRQINLRHIAGDYSRGAKADTGQEHFDLLDRGILRFVQNNERIIQRPSAHESQRRNLDNAFIYHFFNPLKTEHVVQGIVQRPQIRIDFLRHIAGQKAQFFARFDRRAHQNYFPDLFALQGFNGASDRQISLAGTGRADAEVNIMAHDFAQIILLINTAPANHAAFGLDADSLTVRRRHFQQLINRRILHG